jgi:hypothetical protein
LIETPEALNTIIVGNSLSFLMVYNMAPNGQRFTSYVYQKLDRSAESEIWADCTFQHHLGIWRNFVMITAETLNMKFAVNELIQAIAMHDLIVMGF